MKKFSYFLSALTLPALLISNSYAEDVSYSEILKAEANVATECSAAWLNVAADRVGRSIGTAIPFISGWASSPKIVPENGGPYGLTILDPALKAADPTFDWNKNHPNTAWLGKYLGAVSETIGNGYYILKGEGMLAIDAATNSVHKGGMNPLASAYYYFGDVNYDDTKAIYHFLKLKNAQDVAANYPPCTAALNAYKQKRAQYSQQKKAQQNKTVAQGNSPSVSNQSVKVDNTSSGGVWMSTATSVTSGTL